ncbi:hypothetical protein GQ457_15G010500 [Hibiscus cannabinus]
MQCLKETVDCPLARAVWDILFLDLDRSGFYTLAYSEWILENLRSSALMPQFDCAWNTIFFTVVWQLWKWRYTRIFSGEYIGAQSLVQLCVTWAKHFESATHDADSSHYAAIAAIQWQPPGPHWICLNSDGVVHPTTNIGSPGGVFRDHMDGFLLAFHRKLGRTTVLQAELWGVLEGLKLEWSNGYERLIVHIDSSDFHQLLSPPLPDSSLPLIRSIVELFNRAWFVEFSLILREANVVANHMAKNTSRQDSPLTIFETPSVSLVDILHRDLCGSPFSRLTL